MHTYQAKIGYARASTVEQNLDAQIAALKAAGCGMVRNEQKSGTSLERRPELKTILDFINPGEMLVVTRIDRLARSLSDLQSIVTDLKSKGAHLAATEQPVNTSTATGKVFFDMLGVFAEFETNLRRERQAEGIASAKQRGVYRGRKSKIDREAIQTKLIEGCSPTEIAREMGISRGTVYKAKAQMTLGHNGNGLAAS
ncbi:recombinase family protein [Roseovarius sp. D0-M9]|uniref:recombinase family protein n=1 Tax=Roseovarius sp. D0-M9 TaxID=3127117 RepID=UPI00301049CC